VSGLGASRSQTVLLVSLVLGAVAIVGLGTGFLIGIAGSGSPGPAARRTAVSPSSPSPGQPSASTPAARPTVRAASEVEPGRTADVGYLLGSRQAADGVHVTFDRIQQLAGAAADRYARSHGLSQPSPGGFLLVNENPRTRDLVLAPGVRVVGAARLTGQPEPRPVPLDTLLGALAANGPEMPLDLTYDRLGYVVEVREKNTP
jgi:hypothetical protein